MITLSIPQQYAQRNPPVNRDREKAERRAIIEVRCKIAPPNLLSTQNGQPSLHPCGVLLLNWHVNNSNKMGGVVLEMRFTMVSQM